MSTAVDIIETKLVSFSQLFGQRIGELTIESIEVPLIQRDYAQGRKTAGVERIRSQFVAAVCSTLLPDAQPIELDFVYGDVENGKFMPLDGQQRLTLLFLLHCYLAWHQAEQENPLPWVKFSYATRPGAREFCKMLSLCHPQLGVDSKPSTWLIDQAEYLPTWDHDPTIRSMLVVLDELHQWFGNNPVDLEAAWGKLIDEDNPAIRFHLLPMTAAGATDAQYIKMNSRGKPLTPFENFKAQFEEKLEGVALEKAKDFAKKIDTEWSDMLWEYRGDDNLVDDEFMRYFHFVSEVCAWSNGEVGLKHKNANELVYLSSLADKVYGEERPESKENLDFLFYAFDTWQGTVIKDEWGKILTTVSTSVAKRLPIFNAFKKEGVDFFDACCRHYGTSEWDLSRTLFFYGVLLSRNPLREDAEVTYFSRYLRVLRNFLEASRGGEIREEFMPRLLADVRFVMSGNLDQVVAFNQEQKQNELDKQALLEADPALEDILYQLEDHALLRGGLTAFDFNPAKFESRAHTFLKVFDKSVYKEIKGALLAQGSYAKIQKRWTGYHFADFGAPKNDEPWLVLFRGKGKASDTHPLCEPLMTLLDALSTGSTLSDEIQQYLNAPGTPKDWRYYFVKYDVMRQGSSGRYVFSASRYESCMLRKGQLNSYHADPYLCAVVERSGIDEEAIATPKWPNAFYGYETNPRWLELQNGIKLRSVDAGWEVSATSSAQQAIWQQAIHETNGAKIKENTSDMTTLIEVAKNGEEDAVDRIEIAANLLTALVGISPVFD